MLTTAVVYKWRITNAKYIYLTDEKYGEPFIYDINKEMRKYRDDFQEYIKYEKPEVIFTKPDEIIIKEIVSSFDEEGAYKDAFEKMSGLLKSDKDGRYLHLLDYSAYLKDIPECVEGATDVTCNPIDLVFTADAMLLPSEEEARAKIDDVEDIQLPNGSRQRTFHIDFGIPAAKNGNDGTNGLSAFEIAVKKGFTGTTEEQWLDSLIGARGPQGYKGVQGESAFEIAVKKGFTGTTEEQWLDSLKGEKGDDGTIGVNKVQEETIYKILGYDTSSNDSNISYFPYVYNKFILKSIEGESEPENLFYFSSADLYEYKRTYYLNIQFEYTSAASDCVVNPINGYNNCDGLCLCYDNNSYDERMNFYSKGTFICYASNSESLTIDSFKKLHSIYEDTEKGEYEEEGETIIEEYDKDNREICLLTPDRKILYANIIKFRVEVEKTPKKSKNEFIVDKFDKISIKPESELNSNIHLNSVTNENITIKSSDITQKLDNTSIQHYVLESEEIGYQSTMQFNAKSLNIDLLKNKDKVCEIIIGNDNFEIKHKNENIFKVTSKLATFKPEVQAKVNGINDVYLGVPIGTIVMWPLEKAPTGWLICDGAYCSINVFNKLFGVIGFTYGGNKVSGFKVPNLVQKFPLGAANSDPYKLGATGGTEEVTLTKSQMPKHSHQIQKMLTSKSSGSGWVGVNLNGGKNGYIENFEINKKEDPEARFPETEVTGGGQAHNNMPPFLTLNFIIKYM